METNNRHGGSVRKRLSVEYKLPTAGDSDACVEYVNSATEAAHLSKALRVAGYVVLENGAWS